MKIVRYPLLLLLILTIAVVILGRGLVEEKLPVRQSEAKVLELSLENIYSQEKEWVKKLPKSRKRTLIATGDIIPARSVNYRTVSSDDFLWPYEKVAEVLKEADVTFANLEAPLTSDCQPTQEGMIFCGDRRNLEGLIFSGIDVISLANNHAGNFGLSGVVETRDLLRSKDILVTGMNGPVYKDISGLKFAFLGYNEIGAKEEGISWAESGRIQREVVGAKSLADVIVVTFHWGIEYVAQPNSRQKELGHLAIDAGADLVIGNHPHWIQPVEVYKGKIITYAHGNFIFDQMWSQKTREGVVGRYTFLDKKIVDVEFLPIRIEDYGQPYFLEDSEKKNILDEMRQESFILQATK